MVQDAFAQVITISSQVWAEFPRGNIHLKWCVFNSNTVPLPPTTAARRLSHERTNSKASQSGAVVSCYIHLARQLISPRKWFVGFTVHSSQSSCAPTTGRYKHLQHVLSNITWFEYDCLRQFGSGLTLSLRHHPSCSLKKILPSAAAATYPFARTFACMQLH